MARNFAKEGVLAYVVAPGIVKTRMSEISAIARGGIDKVNAILALGEMVPARGGGGGDRVPRERRGAATSPAPRST